jgi:hypothetical protein
MSDSEVSFLSDWVTRPEGRSIVTFILADALAKAIAEGLKGQTEGFDAVFAFAAEVVRDRFAVHAANERLLAEGSR